MEIAIAYQNRNAVWDTRITRYGNLCTRSYVFAKTWISVILPEEGVGGVHDAEGRMLESPSKTMYYLRVVCYPL